MDPTVPSMARIYDYFLGGKDNFPSDRAAAEEVIRIGRESGYDIRELARANRAFLVRVVREPAEAGVRQFLDIGTGLPAQENVHQVVKEIAPDARVAYVDNDPIVLIHARALLADSPETIVLEGDLRRPKEIAPDARVAYVDNDPIVLIHARALLADSPETIVLEGDLRRPKEILDDPQIRDHFDFTQPIAILVLALLHFFTDEDSVRGITATLRDALPSGGYLVVSHAYSATIDKDKADEVRSVYSKTSADGIVHRGPHAEVSRKAIAQQRVMSRECTPGSVVCRRSSPVKRSFCHVEHHATCGHRGRRDRDRGPDRRRGQRERRQRPAR
ncbi:SAM-dependent methyltransferase [Microbispora rosea]|uniref:SAM-dependent methyltransferase n=1 Tax=Microbispora rosea TaxID=58117 RepID=UPI003D93DAD4